jgi:hypothetical protein
VRQLRNWRRPPLPRVVVSIRAIELAAQHTAALKICGRIRTDTDHRDRVSHDAIAALDMGLGREAFPTFATDLESN